MKKINIRSKIKQYRAENGILHVIPCTEQENLTFEEAEKAGEALPEGVFHYRDENGKPIWEYYRMEDPGYTEEEVREFLTYKRIALLEEQAQHLKTIKRCVIFFTVLTVISLVTAIIFGSSLSSMLS